MNKNKYITLGGATAFSANFLLFITKLYIGLSVNSISIYSDAVNNLLDSLSGLISFICFMLLLKSASLSSKSLIKKCEDLLSFIVSVIVGITGFAFAYSSVERLMYPTPVWYRTKYLYLLIVTAVIKLILHFVFRALYKKSQSSLLKVIAFDSLLDFFITAVTVMSLLVSSYGSYSIDAFCGIGISLVIMVSAVKMIVSSVVALIGYVPQEKRESVENMLCCFYGKENVKGITFFFGGEKNEALAEISSRTDKTNEALSQIKNETGITVHIINRKENTE